MAAREAAEEMCVHKVGVRSSMLGEDEVRSFTNALKHLHARRLSVRDAFVVLMNVPILRRFCGCLRFREKLVMHVSICKSYKDTVRSLFMLHRRVFLCLFSYR